MISKPADKLLLRVILQALGLGGLSAISASCGGGVVVDDSSGTSSSSASSSSSGEPVMCGGTPAYGEFVMVCVPMDGDFCPPGEWPAVLNELAAKQGVCAEQNFGDCCNQPALTKPVCDQPPGVNDCCYQAVKVDFGACIGRPFQVEGTARTAEPEYRTDWTAPIADSISSELDSITKAALAQAWLRQARDEHASVAAFARLSLELLAFAAPPSLLRGAQQAMGDEIRHAELAFGIASYFSDETLGPGPLPVDGALPRPTLRDVAISAVREGCIGETIGAALAQQAALECADSALKEALEQIAADEINHAALSFQIVAFALGRDPQLRGAIQIAFEDRPEWPFSPRMPGINEQLFRAHGQWLPDDARTAAEQTFEQVIQPIARALLSAEIPSAPLAPKDRAPNEKRPHLHDELRSLAGLAHGLNKMGERV